MSCLSSSTDDENHSDRHIGVLHAQSEQPDIVIVNRSNRVLVIFEQHYSMEGDNQSIRASDMVIQVSSVSEHSFCLICINCK